MFVALARGATVAPRVATSRTFSTPTAAPTAAPPAASGAAPAPAPGFVGDGRTNTTRELMANLFSGRVFVKDHYVGGRTNVTKALWELRSRESESSSVVARTADAETNSDKPAEYTVVDKAPGDSEKSICLPFTTDPELRAQYISPFGHVRIGRLLEDLDALAGNVAWAHADDANPHTRPSTIVTAGLDRLELRRTLTTDQDMRLRGRVSWVGSSSMEVHLSAETRHEDHWDTVLDSYFTMVAKCAISAKPVKINRLVPANEADFAEFAAGEKRKELRLRKRQSSLSVQPPTPDERLVVHNLFMRSSASPHVPMNTTHRDSLILCQSQERNAHGAIFGGYLLRKGFELSFSTAFLFAHQRPAFVALDDVVFHRPVAIGSLLELKARVIFTRGTQIVVEVNAGVLDHATGKNEKTNTFYFTYQVPEALTLPVFPESYAEAMAYLEGKRKLDGI